MKACLAAALWASSCCTCCSPPCSLSRRVRSRLMASDSTTCLGLLTADSGSVYLASSGGTICASCSSRVLIRSRRCFSRLLWLVKGQADGLFARDLDEGLL